MVKQFFHKIWLTKLWIPIATGLFYLALFPALDLIFPLKVDVPYSTVIYSGDSTVLHCFLAPDDKWRMYTELSEITPRLEKAILFKEDKYFYYHNGINKYAILRALVNNLRKNRRTSGASTITMQVARLLKPKERTYRNKLREMFRALQLEWHYSKEEILQMYFNLVPYGGNIEGVKAASLLYFDKAPDHLSIAQIAALSIIPNRPTSLQIGENNPKIAKERNKWLKRFQEAELFDPQDIQDAIEEPFEGFRRQAPQHAPHFAYRLKKQHPDKALIRSSLDWKKQEKVQYLVKNHVNRLYYNNIHNAAALVIDNQTRQVIAYVGSADFYNEQDAGQVDGITAIRSPGSTLKPLLYGIGFEKGLITPKQRISDVPVNYRGYAPENYDGEYRGNVTIEFALANSLNIPAVKLLEQLKLNEFMNYLKKARFEQIENDERKLGLSVVLGGCGVTLEELTRLYCAFANSGQFAGFNWLRTDTTSRSFQLLSPAAVFMLTEILTQLTRPDLPLQWQNSANLPKVAWKTGTSYGRRDAWSIGYNKSYTVGVWVGNFSGEGVQDLSGANTAAPLLFNIFNSIDYHMPQEWYDMPDEIDFRLVCSESGLEPNSFCKNQIMDYYIPGVSENKKCQHLRRVYISPDSSMAYCTACLPQTGYIKALYPNLSPEIISYYEDFQIQYTKIPPHNPECERVFTKGAPEIVSPVAGLEYFIDQTDTTEIMLACHTAGDVEKVFWYVNDKFFQSAKPTEKVFFQPQKGKIKISCSDDKGRNTNIYIDVKWIRF